MQAGELARVDYAAVVWGGADAGGEEFSEGRFGFLDVLWEDFLVDQGVILRDADLACVDEFAPEEAAGGEADVGVAGDDGGVAAAELEADGGEGFGGFLGDDGPDVGRASVEDFVPFFVKEGCGFFDGALDVFVACWVKGAFDDFLESDGDIGSTFAGLDDCCTACSNGANQWPNEELNWEVVCAFEKVSSSTELRQRRHKV